MKDDLEGLGYYTNSSCYLWLQHPSIRPSQGSGLLGMLGKIILSAVGGSKGDFSQLGGNLGYLFSCTGGSPTLIVVKVVIVSPVSVVRRSPLTGLYSPTPS